MPQPGPQETQEMIAPALQVLWAIRVQVQNHPCCYAAQVNKALDGLVRLQSALKGNANG